ncbi:MAG: cyclic pyranopterin monophosphate synthase MoaC [Bacillota bacterium]
MRTLKEKGLTHFNEEGRARMVDVSGKDNTFRQATAGVTVFMKKDTLQLIREGKMAKGDVLAVAQVAGIMAAKQTPSLIPMCHPLLLTGVDITFQLNEVKNCLAVEATVKVNGQTGVEMEALTAAAAAALTVYDMCKAVDRGMEISNLRLLEKMGGKSGYYCREEQQ